MDSNQREKVYVVSRADKEDLVTASQPYYIERGPKFKQLVTIHVRGVCGLHHS